jgi:ABC-type dipeptide/oligopeptide/nickel transport system permease component
MLAFVIPSDPARTIAGTKADEETVAQIRREMQLDRPLAVQYASYLGRLLRGDLGRSYVTREPVARAIWQRLPATALLAVTSLLIAVTGGIVLGCVTSVRAGRKVDMAVLLGSLTVLSVPVFWLGMLFLYGFAYRLRWLPLGGFGTPSHLILPAFALALGSGAYYARLLHTTMQNVLGEDFVRTAHAKGLPRRRVYFKHALRNALIPLTTVVGLDFAALMSGVVLTETVFNWPGVGRLAVTAVFNQDIPMIMGTVMFGAVLVVVTNVVVDLLYVVIDPRQRT